MREKNFRVSHTGRTRDFPWELREGEELIALVKSRQAGERIIQALRKAEPPAPAVDNPPERIWLQWYGDEADGDRVMNTKIKDLIRRARELAALAEKATPGPWEWRRWGLYSCDAQKYVLQSESNPDCEQRPVGDNYFDYELIAAAPEMALLLGQLADVLESKLAPEPHASAFNRGGPEGET